MSDPVTNAEVEDVLSSIRRLVSEDKRPLQAQKPISTNDRLVLTPALRVADPVDDHDPKPVFKLENVVDIADQGEDAAGKDTVLDDPTHDYEADPYNFSDDMDKDGEGDIADAFTDSVELDTALDEADDAIQDDTDDGTGKAASLSSKIEALETAIGNISERWEPDDTGSDEYSGIDAPAMAWEDDVTRDATGALLDDVTDEAVENIEEIQVTPEPTPQKDTAETDSFAFASEDQLIDEEALRDLVSDIVRAELQGALGERITRNVRKLVRREIHRALTAQDLE